MITSDNEDFYEDIRLELKRYVPAAQIFDMFDRVRDNRDTRIETLRLNAERINRCHIQGNVAEVGVWKGNFARYINKYFCQRKLYLFDTFEGFEEQRLAKDIDQVWGQELDFLEHKYENPEWENILNDFPYPENCIIRKGYFPYTAEGIEDIFAFVSLDVDVYAGTKSGLDFFWPRMVSGGMIMIHDYNSNGCPGVMEAVDEFSKRNNIYPICISDHSGSVILLKQE